MTSRSLWIAAIAASSLVVVALRLRGDPDPAAPRPVEAHAAPRAISVPIAAPARPRPELAEHPADAAELDRTRPPREPRSFDEQLAQQERRDAAMFATLE